MGVHLVWRLCYVEQVLYRFFPAMFKRSGRTPPGSPRGRRARGGEGGAISAENGLNGVERSASRGHGSLWAARHFSRVQVGCGQSAGSEKPTPLLGPEESHRPLLDSPFQETYPALSPDGRWLVYVSNASGRPEVYVEPVPATGQRWQISSRGGDGPLWAPDGSEIIYWRGRRLMAVRVTMQPLLVPARSGNGSRPGSWTCSTGMSRRTVSDSLLLAAPRAGATGYPPRGRHVTSRLQVSRSFAW